MKTAIMKLLAICAFLSCFAPLAYAAPPNLITYQGRLKENNQPVTGNRVIEIFLCDALAGPTCTGTGEQTVYVSTGLFKSTFTVPMDISAGAWYLELKVGGAGGQVLSPREQLSSVPYALLAATAAYVSGAVSKTGDSMTGPLSILNSSMTVIGTPGVNPGVLLVSTGASSPLLYVSTRGFTGINTSSPQYPLHIISNQGTQVGLRVDGYDSSYDSIYINSYGSGKPAYGYVKGGLVALTYADASGFHADVAGDEKLTITADSKVGIKNTTPSYRLHISSGAGETGTVMAVSTGATNLFWVAGDGAHASAYYGDGSGLTGVTASGAVAKTGDNMTGSLELLNNSTLTVTGSAFSVGGSTLVVVNGNVGIGAVVPGSRLEVAGGSSTFRGSDGNSSIAGFTDAGGNYRMIISTPGNVGIGTTAPTSKLHVSAGDINIDLGQAFMIGNELVVRRDAGGVTVGSNLITPLILRAGGEKARITTDGSVGIGTTAPVSRFDVLDGSITVRGANAALVFEDFNRRISSEAAADLGAGIRVSTNVYIVGFSSAAKYYGDGSALTNITASGSVLKTGDVMSGPLLIGSTAAIIAPDTAVSSLWVSTSIITPHLYVSTGGNVGIGTAGPGSPLFVSGAGINVTGGNLVTGIVSANSGGGGGPQGVWIGGTNTGSNGSGLIGPTYQSGNLVFAVGTNLATTAMLIKPTGSVGIGTTVPLSKFDVLDGSITVRGANAALVFESFNRRISSEAAADLGAGIRVSTNVYIVGFSSAAAYYGDGSTLSNLPGDGLGNHVATTTLQMAQFPIVNVSSIAIIGSGIQIATSVYAGASGIFISTAGSIATLGLGNGTFYPNARGIGAVDLQTVRTQGTHVASGNYSVVSGGQSNTASGNNAVVSGGNANLASQSLAVVGGGNNNMASGILSTIPGGDTNFASGLRSFAAGSKASSSGDGAFTWADSEVTLVENDVADRTWFKNRGGFLVSGSTNAAMSGTANRGMLVTGNGLVGISTGVPQAALDVVSTGTLASQYAQIWRDSTGLVVASMTANGKLSTLQTMPGDSLGNHTAAQDLNMAGHDMIGVSTISVSSITTAGAGVTFSTNAFFMNGKVGIGTDSPDAALQIDSTAVGISAPFHLKLRNTANGAGPYIYLDSVDRKWVIQAKDPLPGSGNESFVIRDYTLAAERFSIDSAGNVGIGPAAPLSKFDVQDGSITVRGTSAALVFEDFKRTISSDLGAGIRVSTDVYIIGFSSAAAYYGDGSALTNVISPGAVQKAGDTMTGQLTIAGASVTVSGDVTAANYRINGGTVLAILPGSGSMGIGINAGKVSVGNYNVFVGSAAGQNTTSGIENTFVGSYAGSAHTTGYDNAFLGYYSGANNMTGTGDTFLGAWSAFSNTTGNNNSVVGYQAALNNTNGSANAILGKDAGLGAGGLSFSSSTLVGYSAGRSLTTGSDNILLGWQAGDAITTGSRNIVLGYDQDPSGAAVSNELNIGGVLFGDLAAKTIGISTRSPQAALDIVAPGAYTQIWRNSIGTPVSSMTSAGVLYGDGSGLRNVISTGAVQKAGDTMAGALDMAGFEIGGVSTITMLNGSIAIVPPGTGGSNAEYGISIGSNTYNNMSYGLGVGMDAFGNSGFGLGVGASASGNYGSGVGVGVSASNNYSYGVGVGASAYNNYTSGTGVGYGANENNNSGVGVGASAFGNFINGVGVGASAYGNSNSGVGVGNNASDNSFFAVGIGAYSRNNATYGSALGAYSYAASSSTALGSYAKANAKESIAIGAGTVNNSTGTAGFGAYAIYTSSNITAVKYYGDGSALSNIPGDGLGSHVATTTLQMAQFPIVNVSSIAIIGAGIQIATSVYAGASGIFISTAGSIMTVGIGNGTVQPSARGLGAVDLQTYRSAPAKVAGGSYSVISGGYDNAIGNGWSNIGGGQTNQISGYDSVIGGGANNTVVGNRAVVPGGMNNIASADNTFAAGYMAQATAAGSFVWADGQGLALVNSVPNQFLVRSQGGFYIDSSSVNFVNGANSRFYIQNDGKVRIGAGSGNPVAVYALDISTVNSTDDYVFRAGANGIVISTGGAVQTTGAGHGSALSNPRGMGAVDLQTSRTAGTQVASGKYSNIAGGQGNQAAGESSAIGGGANNLAGTPSANYSVVAGGIGNHAIGDGSAVGGGSMNIASGASSVVPGGLSNVAQGNYSFAAGYMSSSTANGTFTWADGTGDRVENNVLNRTWFKSAGGFLVTASTQPSADGSLRAGNIGTSSFTVQVDGNLSLGNGTPGGNTPVTITLMNQTGGAVSYGDIVVIHSFIDNAFNYTNTASSTTVLGVVYDPSIGFGVPGRIAIHGVVKIRTATPVTRGQAVITSATPGQAGVVLSPAAGTSIGKWLQSGGAGALIDAVLLSQ